MAVKRWDRSVSRNRVLPLVLVLVLAFLPGLAGAGGGAGTTGAPVLRIPTGARPEGFGGAYAGVADDLSALFWNPAGLAGINAPEAGALYTSYIAQTSYQVLGYAQPIGRWGAIALGAGMLDYGSLVKTVAEPDGLYGGTSGSVSAADWLVAGGWGMRVMDWGSPGSLDAGITLKSVINQQGPDGNISAGGGFGLLWRTPVPGVRLAAVGDNLGTSIKGSGMMPAVWRLGSAWEYSPSPIVRTILAADEQFTADAGNRTCAGLEATFIDLIAVRGGWSGGTAAGGISFGAGFLVPPSWTGMPASFRLDYSGSSLADLGFTHRVQVIARFGGASVAPHGIKMAREGAEKYLTWEGGRGPFEVTAVNSDTDESRSLSVVATNERRLLLPALPPGRYQITITGVKSQSTAWPDDNEGRIRIKTAAPAVKPALAAAVAPPLPAPLKLHFVREAGRTFLLWEGTAPAYEVFAGSTDPGATLAPLSATPLLESRMPFPKLGPGHYRIVVRAMDPADPSRPPADSADLRINVKPAAPK